MDQAEHARLIFDREATLVALSADEIKTLLEWFDCLFEHGIVSDESYALKARLADELEKR